MNEREEEIQHWRAALRAHEDRIPPEVASRLDRLRRKALEAGRRRSRGARMALAMAALVLLALALHLYHPEPVLPQEPTDFVMLIEDDPEFLADLEFYAWLEAQNDSG
ncbi:MAG: hypothetical protein D6721_03060 [Gammaproteobacteria bacterium]|nr:MAG: hypothetical protein D6721_03060 [Gammaproteobacteria bacterium]